MTDRRTAAETEEQRRVRVRVDNLGGIDHCELTVPPGLTVFEGRNATNRTSLLAAIAGALGGSAPRLKTDAEEGAVELDLAGTSCRREYRRDGGSVRVRGEPYTERADLVDTFVTLLSTNPIRQSVRGGGPLRDLLMRPVDTDRIESEIAERKRERDRAVERIRELERERERLPRLRERRSERAEELADVEERLEAARAAVEAVDEDAVSETRALLDDLEQSRKRLREVRDRIDHQSAEIERLREEAADLEGELADGDAPGDELERLEEEKRRLEDRERRLTNQIDDLLAIVSFNDDLLEEGAEGLPGVETGERSPAARLEGEGDRVVCWTCGSHVERDEIADRLDGLREVVSERRREREEARAEVEAVEEELAARRRTVERREERERALEETRGEIDHREEKLASLEAEAAALESTVEELRSDVDAADDARTRELLERYEEVSELEYERGQLEGTIDDLESEIETLQEHEETIGQLESQVDELEGELDSLRTRVERVETEVVDAFNDHMAELIDRLGYRNVARVWLDRKVETPEGAEGTFSLHVVRESEGGSVYEDSIETLSESERELIGLVLAFAGYLVHDVDETVPVMLLDSVEAIDGERIADLLAYLEDHVPYLLVALLPEDVAAVSPTTTVSADGI